MSFFSLFLLPFSWLYRLLTDMRNTLYDKHILPSFPVNVATIGVGNLEVGGTGKTPFVEYLIRLHKDKMAIGVLSRGYKRRTRGYKEVRVESSCYDVGDEMKQMKKKFPSVPMAVCEKRIRGINMLLTSYPDLQLIILDDVFQHRQLICDRYILLTRFDRLYVHDHLLPYGRLREKRSNACRASTIVVTKCPPVLTHSQQQAVIESLNPMPRQEVRFATLQYTHAPLTGNVLVVTGIAHPEPLLQHIQHIGCKALPLIFPDHHHFTNADIQKIAHLANRYNCVVTTEKDLMRLEETDLSNRLSVPLICVQIELCFINQ